MTKDTLRDAKHTARASSADPSTTPGAQAVSPSTNVGSTTIMGSNAKQPKPGSGAGIAVAEPPSSNRKEPRYRPPTSNTDLANPNLNPNTDSSNPKQPRYRPAQMGESDSIATASGSSIIASQKMPSSRPANFSADGNISEARTSSQPPPAVEEHGAYAVGGTARSHSHRSVTAPTESQDFVDKPDPPLAQITSASAMDADAAAESGLIQADLVHVGQADVVEGSILTPKCRKRLMFLGVAGVVAIALAATLGVVLPEDSSKEIEVTAAPTVSMAPTVSTAPSMTPTAAPTFSIGKAVVTTQELYEAVDAYLDNPDPSSDVAAIYGWPIGRWNVSGITDMAEVFYSGRSAKAVNFNEDLSDWDVSRVTNFFRMFAGAGSFNQPLTEWDTSSATTLESMFQEAVAFNSDVSTWNVSRVVNMVMTFREAKGFNQPIGDWDTSSVNTFEVTFWNAAKFNQPIGAWDVSRARDFGGMFSNATSFNQPLGDWDTSAALYMYRMFRLARSFNQPIGNWTMSSVEDTERMFEFAQSFNQPLADWDLSSSEWFHHMFYGAWQFNQDISSWDVGSGDDFHAMFLGATSFNQDLCAWGPTLNSTAPEMGVMFYATNCTYQDTPNLAGTPIGRFCANSCGYTPPPPPPPNNDTEVVWEFEHLEQGECVVDGNCVQSHADLDRSDYEANQACIFVAMKPGTLKVEKFNTETHNDILFIMDEDGSLGEGYSGTSPSGLDGRPIEADTVFVWASDYDYGGGWKLCLVP